MRGRPVHLIESLRIGLRRFFPVLAWQFGAAILTALAGILLVIPAFIVATMLLVAMPACVVEQLGPVKSMDRSKRLTKDIAGRSSGSGFWRWSLRGFRRPCWLDWPRLSAGSTLALITFLAWSAIFGAFYAIMVGGDLSTICGLPKRV